MRIVRAARSSQVSGRPPRITVTRLPRTANLDMAQSERLFERVIRGCAERR